MASSGYGPILNSLFKREDCEPHGSYEVCTTYYIVPWKLGVGITIAVLAILIGVIQICFWRRKKREQRRRAVEVEAAFASGGKGEEGSVQAPPPAYGGGKV